MGRIPVASGIARQPKSARAWSLSPTLDPIISSIGGERDEDTDFLIEGRTVSQRLAKLTGKPQKTARAVLDASKNDQESTYSLLMSDLELSVTDELPCEVVQLQPNMPAWISEDSRVLSTGALGGCSLLRVPRCRKQQIQLLALEPVQVFVVSEMKDPIAKGWTILDGMALPEVEGLDLAEASLHSRTFNPGPVEVPLAEARLAAVRLLRHSKPRTPRNSAQSSVGCPSVRVDRRGKASSQCPPLWELEEAADSSEPVTKASGSSSRPEDLPSAVERAPSSVDNHTGKSRYRLLSTIGVGNFGKVHLAETPTKTRVALKCVFAEAIGKSREVELLSSIKHPCVVKVLDSYEATGVDGRRLLHIVMEFLPETLHSAIGNAPVSLSDLRCYTFQLLRSLAHLDGMGICHRDVKPENILLSGKALKLADFGTAKLMTAGGSSGSYVCSRWWRAPELVLGKTDYTTSIDWWSAGCVVAEMMLGQPLFPGESSWGQMYTIVRTLGTPSRQEVDALSRGRHDARLAGHLDKLARLERPSRPWREVLPAFAEFPEALELPERLLCYSPEERWHPARALLCRFLSGLVDDAGALPEEVFSFTKEELQAAGPKARRQLLALSGKSRRKKAEKADAKEKEDGAANDTSDDTEAAARLPLGPRKRRLQSPGEDERVLKAPFPRQFVLKATPPPCSPPSPTLQPKRALDTSTESPDEDEV